MFANDNNVWVYDIESAPNDFLIVMKRLNSDVTVRIGRENYSQVLDNLLESRPFLVGYNNVGYDSLLLTALVKYYKVKPYAELAGLLNTISKDIIYNGNFHVKVRRDFHLGDSPFGEFDVKSYADGSWKNGSLKGWEIRLGLPTVDENPFDVDKDSFTDEEYSVWGNYCEKDVRATEILVNHFADEISAKTALIANYLKGDELAYLETDRSLVESILSSNRTHQPRLGTFRYVCPVPLSFDDPQLQQVYDEFSALDLSTTEQNNYNKKVVMGNGLEITFSLGGVHGVKPRSVQENVIDADVASYYPNLITRFGFYNPENFVQIGLYAEMIRNRVAIKKSDPALASAQKLILNTTYGALNYKKERKGSGEVRYGRLYDAVSQIHICVTGQLLLAKLADALMSKGYDVVYLNTDGLSFVDNGSGEHELLLRQWSEAFGMTLETSRYKRMWFRDVNHYIAIDDSGKVKTKGEYDTSPGQSGHAHLRVATDAVVAHVTTGMPIETFVELESDLSAFILHHKFKASVYKSIGLYPSDVANRIRELLESKKVEDAEEAKKLFRHDFKAVVRYVLGKPTLRNDLVAVNSETGGAMSRDNTFSIIPVPDLTKFDVSQIDRSRYVELAYKELSKLLPAGLGVSPKMRTMIDATVAKFGVAEGDLVPADGKKNLTGGQDIYSELCYTLKVRTGADSKIMCLDVDRPETESARKLLKYVKPEHLIVRSDKHSLDDVFAGRCRYKVFYRFDGKNDLSSKKANVDVECFYHKNKTVGVAGRKGDGTDYVATGDMTDLHFHVNDVLQATLPDFNLNGNKAKAKRKVKIDGEDVEIPDADVQKVSVREFSEAISHYVPIPGNLRRKDDHTLLFSCLFPGEHSSARGNNAYAWKTNGHYVAKCHGVVCADSYLQLNRQLEADSVKAAELPDFPGFGLGGRKGVTVFQAPTGWGKTEKLAEEVVRAVKNNGRLTVLLQTKEAMTRLLGRVESKIGKHGAVDSLKRQRKIFEFKHETNTSADELAPILAEANVVLSHHYYFAPSGDVWKTYKAAERMMSRGGTCFIDEAHTWQEMATRMTMDVSASYTRSAYKDSVRYNRHRERLTSAQFESKTQKGEIYNFSRVIRPMLNSMHRQFNLRVENQMAEFVIDGERTTSPDLLDLGGLVRRAFGEPIEVLDETRGSDDSYPTPYVYELYRNDHPVPMTGEENYQKLGVEDLIYPSEWVLIAHKVGDGSQRKDLGVSTASFFCNQLARRVFASFSQTVLVSATFMPFELEKLAGIANYEHVKIEEKVNKIGTIVLLSSERVHKGETLRRLMETLESNSQTAKGDKAVKALIFTPTKEHANKLLVDYPHSVMNDNGMYIMGRNPNSATGDSDRFNTTLVALEASPAKGFNYFEEVDPNEPGFKLVYFDSPPVSPDLIKKGVLNGAIHDYNFDYAAASFAQALGRAMRKDKKLLVVAVNDGFDAVSPMIRDYLESETSARVITGDLDITNLHIALGTGNFAPGALVQNELWLAIRDVL